MLAFSLVMLGRALRAAKNSQSAKVRALPDMTKLKTPLAVFGGTVAYALAMRYVGYFVGTTVFFLCAMTLLGRNRLRTALIASAVFMSVMYALFIWFLGMRLPEGLLV